MQRKTENQKTMIDQRSLSPRIARALSRFGVPLSELLGKPHVQGRDAREHGSGFGHR